MLIKHSLNKELLINYCIIKMMNLQHKYTHTYTRQHMKINFPHKKSSQLNYLCLRTQNEFNEFSLIIYLNVTKIFKFNSSSTTLSQHLFIYYSVAKWNVSLLLLLSPVWMIMIIIIIIFYFNLSCFYHRP